ncbi:DUF1837 domain-containing protein [bacterium]|nr:DUF1837 domain-containing protein [bacterium]
MGTSSNKSKSNSAATFVLTKWLDHSTPEAGEPHLALLQERTGGRALVETAFRQTVKDHLAGLSIIHRIKGYEKSLAYIRNKVPQPIEIRSGDCGEILATEYIEQCTRYQVPIKRLRWKDDRNTAMRGDDVLALRKSRTRWHVLKAESKSRASLSASVVSQAVSGLLRNAGRPNPSSLAFISTRLRELDRHDEADVFDDLQTRSPKRGEIEHLVFTLSGNDPCGHLKAHLAAATDPIRRHMVGCVVPDHQTFINAVFDAIIAGR